MKRLLLSLAATSLLLAGCTIGGTKPADDTATTDTTGGGGTPGGGNPGGGNPGGGETGDTSDTASGPGGPGGGADVDCDTTEGAPSGPSCVSGVIRCGEVIEGNTRGGTNMIDDAFYESATCFVPYHDFESTERVYEFILDGGGEPITADITLDAPCGDLGLAVFFWTEDECPEGNLHNITNCDGKDISNSASAFLYSTGEDPDRYLIAVDGDETAAFRLEVQCDQ